MLAVEPRLPATAELKQNYLHRQGRTKFTYKDQAQPRLPTQAPPPASPKQQGPTQRGPTKMIYTSRPEPRLRNPTGLNQKTGGAQPDSQTGRPQPDYVTRRGSTRVRNPAGPNQITWLNQITSPVGLNRSRNRTRNCSSITSTR